MKFADWLNGSNIIPAGGNMRFYSLQSTNAMGEATAIPITSSTTWSDIMDLNPNIDLNSTNEGRQIEIFVEAKIPTTAISGSYSTSYDINTTATSTITIASTTQTYDSTPRSVSITTDPADLATSVTYTGIGDTSYDASTTPPIHAGIYNVYAEVTDPGYTGTSTATLTIQQAPVSVTPDHQTKVYDGATSTDHTLTYQVSPSDAPYGNDQFTGSLSRDQYPDEDAGTYTINQGSLALDSDYVLTYNPEPFFNITQAPAMVTLGNLEQTYDKTGKSVGVTTDPAGLNVDVTYNGSSELPVNASTTPYAVVATIDENNYYGSTTGDLFIGQAPLTVTATTSTKVYDGTADSDGVPMITSGTIFSGDTAPAWTQTYNNKNVGTDKILTPAGIVEDGNSGDNYDVTYATTTGVINSAPVTVTATGVGKQYDGTTTATVNLTVNGKIGGDDVVATDTATFDTKDVGPNKTVTVDGISLIGTDSGNYSLSDTSTTTTADITVAPLTITAKDISKLYGDTVTLSATSTGFTYSGLLDDDSVDTVFLASDGAASTSPISGSPYAIVPSDATGTGLSNYSINYVNGNLSVSKNNLTAIITADGKVYDGTTGASMTRCTPVGIVNDDPITCTATDGTFDNRDVGTNKIVTADVNFVGTNLDNYTTVSTATTTASISVRPITVTATSTTKVYDGDTTSNGIPTITSGSIATDDTAPTWTQTYNNKDVGTDKILTPAGIVDDGNSGNNYDVTYATTTGVITAKDLTVTANGTDKVYDGTASTTVVLSDNRITGDVLDDNYTSANFLDPNVGNGKQVNVYGISITGTDADNYHLTNVSASTTADITKADMTITADDASKTYGQDKTFVGTEFTTNPVSLFGSDKVDSVTLTSTGAAPTSDVGSYDIVPSTATGTGLGNYTIAYDNGQLTVNPLALTGTLTASNKTYDGTPNASTSCSLSGVLFGDDVSCVTANSVFSTRNAGTNQVTASLSLTGGKAVDYSVNGTASTTATISQLALTVTAQSDDRTYNGTTTSSVLPEFTPPLGTGDSANFIETYSTKNVGSGLTLTPSGVVNDGHGGANYTYTFDNNTNGTITAEPLIVTATTNTKVYDGNTSALATPSVSGTIFGTDSPNFTEAYSAATAGTGLTLTPNGNVTDGNGGLNYTYTFDPIATGVITQAIPKLVYGVFSLVNGDSYSEIVGDINAHGGHAYYGITDDSNHRVDGTFSTIPVSGAVSGTTTPLYINIMFTPNDVTNFSTVNQTAEFNVVSLIPPSTSQSVSSAGGPIMMANVDNLDSHYSQSTLA